MAALNVEASRDLRPWIPLPTFPRDSHEWHADVRSRLAPAHWEDQTRVESLLTEALRLSLTDPLPGTMARFMFTPDNVGSPVLFTILAVEANGNSDASQRELLGLDDLGSFVGKADDLREVGVEGYQLLRIDEEMEDPHGQGFGLTRSLVATLATVIRRRMALVGDVDLYAVARSTRLTSVASAIVPVISLLRDWEFTTSIGGGAHI